MASIQRWDQVHDSLLEGYKLHTDDVAVIGDSKHYGERYCVQSEFYDYHP